MKERDRIVSQSPRFDKHWSKRFDSFFVGAGYSSVTLALCTHEKLFARNDWAPAVRYRVTGFPLIWHNFSRKRTNGSNSNPAEGSQGNRSPPCGAELKKLQFYNFVLVKIDSYMNRRWCLLPQWMLQPAMYVWPCFSYFEAHRLNEMWISISIEWSSWAMFIPDFKIVSLTTTTKVVPCSLQIIRIKLEKRSLTQGFFFVCFSSDCNNISKHEEK